MNIVIAGGRDFGDYEFLKSQVDYVISLQPPGTSITVVCGMAKGADLLGRQYAKEKGHNVIDMPANWDRDGRRAGPLRNIEMCKIADMTIAFWDQESRGTAHMIKISKEKGIPVHIYNY